MMYYTPWSEPSDCPEQLDDATFQLTERKHGDELGKRCGDAASKCVQLADPGRESCVSLVQERP